jgi:hypothetical protein
MTMWAGSSPDQAVRGWPHTVETHIGIKSTISIAVVLIKDDAPPKRRTTTMTAFAGPRIAARPTTRRVARPAATSSFRSSLRGLRGAFSASANGGADYADALLLARN